MTAAQTSAWMLPTRTLFAHNDLPGMRGINTG